ncbi:MAG: hypothetical protein KDA58_10925, partial [Planctomycetaceae bacterium]|nr:hypothetical protein [Planctomycetaceae bacterium]
ATPQDPLYVESDELRLMIAHDVGRGLLDLREAEGTGAIRIDHHSPEQIKIGKTTTQQELSVTGVGFLVRQSEQGDQTVTLVGRTAENGDVTEPAMLEMGTMRFGGGLVTLDRRNNVITVDGPGVLAFPVPVDLNGEELDEPAILEIKWRERMTFDGLQARFFGAVQASTESDAESISRLECEEMLVELVRRVMFEQQSSRPSPELKFLTCRHHVRIDAYTYTGTSLTSRRHAELAEFTVDRQTGKFTGTGPGAVDDWTFDTPVRLTPQAAPRANQPVNAKQPTWRYTHLKFHGEITGNFTESWAELADRVEVITAPVDKPSQTFSRHDLSGQTDQAANAAWLGCNRLRVTFPDVGSQHGAEEASASRSGTRSRKRQLELLAYEHTELEGQVFHATADEITFDEHRGRFILRGQGRDARLHFQEAPGAPINTTENRLIEFIPSKPSITLDGSTGLNGGL